MSEIGVDTSVVVEWYLPEQYYPQPRALRDAYFDEQIEPDCASPHVV